MAIKNELEKDKKEGVVANGKTPTNQKQKKADSLYYSNIAQMEADYKANQQRQNNATTTTTTTTTPTTTAAPTVTPTYVPQTISTPSPTSSNIAPSYIEQQIGKINGVDDETFEKYKSFLGQDIISQDVKDAMGTKFQTSAAYEEAMRVTNGFLEQLNSGKTSYSDRVASMLDQIMSRDKFSYDMSTDTLFQQSLSSAMADGRLAMENTMGQAAALTGGYGSSYAQAVGNQAYNNFIQDAYDNLPQYYQMALEAYQSEGDEMYRQFSALSEADMQEYERTYNAYTTNFNQAQTMYNQEYQTWADQVNNAFKMAGLQLDENNQQYNQYADYIKTLNSDWWNTTDFNESVRQYEQNFAEQQRQYDQDYAEKVRQFNENFAEEQRQFNSKQALSKAQFDEEMQYKKDALTQSNNQWKKEYELNSAKVNASKNSSSTNETKLKAPDDKIYEKALEIYNSYGYEDYLAYLDSIEAQGYDATSIVDYVEGKDGDKSYPGRGMLPLEKRTYTKVGFNEYEDQYHIRHKKSDLPDSVKKTLK